MPIIKQYINKLILRGGKIIIPDKKIIDNPDIYIENGIIKQIKYQKTRIENIKTILLNDSHFISPGFIDLHCHLREPGNPESETIKSGTLSAIAGGFTTVCCMPNTMPPLDNSKTVKYVHHQSKIADNARVLVIGCATKNRLGNKVANISAMKSAGIVAVSDDGSPITDSMLMQKLLEQCQVLGIFPINHCEVLELSNAGMINEGRASRKLGLKGIPDISESIMVLRDIVLSEYTKSRVHIAHVSTRKSVDLIRWAKKRGVKITAETCPHYFTLSEDDCLDLDTNYKVSPSLRTKADVEAIKQGLADGTIDAIATDHAPWHRTKKQDSWEKAKSGMIGFETAFSLGYQELVLKKYLTLEQYIACLTTKPANILNLKDAGKIAVGFPAAITIVDLGKNWTPSIKNIMSKSKNSPFIGRKLKGKIEKVVIQNKLFHIN
jgi:dihydroorotase